MAAKKQHKFSIRLPGYSRDQREAIALDIIDQIIKRSKQGKDRNGDSFPSYSPSYKRGLDFKIAGKTMRVNLTLSGDMLDSMKVLENTDDGSKVTIGFSRGRENDKAEGNILGTYGQKSPIDGGKYARDFLGVQESELDKILRKYPKGTARADRNAQAKLEAEQAAREFTRTSFEFDEDDDG